MQSYVPAQKRRFPKSVKRAVLLQISPLLTVAGCTDIGLSSGTFGDTVPFLSFVSAFGVLFAWMVWGLGYGYLGHLTRFGLSFALGPVFVLSSCYASFHGIYYDFEHGGGRAAGYHHAAFQQAIIIGAVTLLIMVDTWRLAVRYNAQLVEREEQVAYWRDSIRFEPDSEIEFRD